MPYLVKDVKVYFSEVLGAAASSLQHGKAGMHEPGQNCNSFSEQLQDAASLQILQFQWPA